MKINIMDKLFSRVEERGVVCLGLDTALEYIPEHILKETSEEEAIFKFNKEIIDATLDVVACFKVQIAYYEALGLKGLMAYSKTLDYLKRKRCYNYSRYKKRRYCSNCNAICKGSL